MSGKYFFPAQSRERSHSSQVWTGTHIEPDPVLGFCVQKSFFFRFFSEKVQFSLEGLLKVEYLILARTLYN